MNLMYLLLIVPFIIMTVIGAVMCSAHKKAIMGNHHFATNFNIQTYAKQTMLLFTLTGIMFTISGFVAALLSTTAGFVLLGITLIIFIIVLSKTHRN